MEKNIAEFILSTAFIGNISKQGKIPESTPKEIKEFCRKSNMVTYEELFQASFKEISRNYKNELFYKYRILKKYLVGKQKNPRILFEFPVGNSVADCVLIGKEIEIIEIKTEYDSLQRIEKQVSDYYKVSPRVSILISQKLLKKIDRLETIFPNMGIYILGDRGGITLHRKSKDDFHNLSKSIMLSSLRKKEYIAIAQNYSKTLIPISSARAWTASISATEKADSRDINIQFVNALKNRWDKSYFEEVMKFPDSLWVQLLSKKYRRNEIESIHLSLKEKISC